MRRRWPVLAATIPLVLGWALAAAHPAAARTGAAGAGGLVQPGGPITQSLTGGPNAAVTSSNWAGYAATGSAGQFTGVSGSWIQPAGQCAGDEQGDAYAAFWVGLDGYTGNTVEQTGSEVDCAGGSPEYYAWYELYPGTSVNFTNPVRPGDHFTASVSYQGSNQFQITLADTTQDWTQSVTKTVAGAARSSAEVITEAPSSGSSTLPLTDFGTVGFTGVTVNDAGLCTTSPTEITMPVTSVSDLSNCGDFTIANTGAGLGFPWPAGGL